MKKGQPASYRSTANNMNGKFIISLDFELHWGAAEKWDLNSMTDYFNETRKSIPEVLSLFEKYQIHATWATVGFLFAKNKAQLRDFCPTQRPMYKNNALSYYSLIDDDQVGNDENDDPYHFATSLISKIINTPHQELASHTFAHYYCNEPGQQMEQFSADLKAAQDLSKHNFGIELQSLVFPRNQFNAQYVKIAKAHGIKVVRSNPDVWFWKNESALSPLFRAADTLFPISGSLTFYPQPVKNGDVLLLPASRFLRPYSDGEKMIQRLKMSRIKSEMFEAASKNKAYHLWWHPHNFGYSTELNIKYLEEILVHFEKLRQQFDFESASMIEMYTGL